VIKKIITTAYTQTSKNQVQTAKLPRITRNTLLYHLRNTEFINGVEKGKSHAVKALPTGRLAISPMMFLDHYPTPDFFCFATGTYAN